MAELTPVSKINYDTFKKLYNSNLPYNQQSQGILQKFDENTFNQYSNIANQEPKLGFLDKITGGLANLFAAQGAEPDYVNPNLAEMLAQQNYQNTLAYSPMFDNRNRFKEDIIPERMIDAPMDLESIMAGSILDKGITNRSLIGDLPNLNYRNYLINLLNRNETTQPDFINAPQDDYASLYSTQPNSQDYYQPMAMRKDLGFDTSYGIANEPDVEQVDYLPGQKKSFRDSKTLEEYSKNRSLSQGLESLLQYLPFGEKSPVTYLLNQFLPKESPEMKSIKSFYRDKYGLDSVGRVASGNMAGYNPVSGGLLNIITGGKYGKPPTIGLQKSYQKNIDLIQRNLDRGIYRDAQAKRNKLNELIRDKRADKMASEIPTIDRAKAAASNVYSKAAANKALGPGGGFSTSGKEGAFSSKSGIGRQDY